MNITEALAGMIIKVRFFDKKGELMTEDEKEGCSYWSSPYVQHFTNNTLRTSRVMYQRLDKDEKVLYIHTDFGGS